MPGATRALRIPKPTDEATSLSADAGWVLHRSFVRHSSLGKEAGDFVSGNRAFANDAPARGLVAQIDDGGGHVSRRIAAIDNDIDAALQLVAQLLRAGALRSTAQGCRGSSDRARRRR